MKKRRASTTAPDFQVALTGPDIKGILSEVYAKQES